MALDKSILNLKFKKIQESLPSSIDEAASKWSGAIFDYSFGAQAGITIPSNLNKSLLENLIKTSMNSEKMLNNLLRKEKYL